MAIQTAAQYLAQMNTLYADNANEDIAPIDFRTDSTNISQSVPFLIDAATISGIWTHTAVLKGVTPVAGEDLATKAYVDANAGVAAGDVVGPSTSFDNEIAIYDGLTGKLIKGGTGVRLASNGDMSGLGDLSFATSTKTLAGIQVGNLTDSNNTQSITGAWTFTDINVPLLPTADEDAASKKYVDDNIGSGDVGISGTPVDNQVAIWTGPGNIEGDSNLTWNAATNTFAIGGTFSANDITIDNIVLDGNTISTTSGDLILAPTSGDTTSTTFNDVPLTATGSSSNFLTEAGTYATIAGGGDVLSTGTPVNNQIAVWTNSNTIEGGTDFTWDGITLGIPSGGFGATLTGDQIQLQTAGQIHSRLNVDETSNVTGVAGASLFSSSASNTREALEILCDIETDTGAIPALILNSTSGAIALSTRPTIAGYNHNIKQWEVGADGTWDFQNNDLNNINDITRGVDNERLIISGGSTTTLGANISLTGNTDPANVDSVIFRIDSTDTLVIDASGGIPTMPTITDTLTVNQTGTSNIVDFQDSGSSVFTIVDGGDATFSGSVAMPLNIKLSKENFAGNSATTNHTAVIVGDAVTWKVSTIAIRASAIQNDSSSPISAWYLYNIGNFNGNIAVSLRDSGGDTGSFTVTISDLGGTTSLSLGIEVATVSDTVVTTVEVDNADGVTSLS